MPDAADVPYARMPVCPLGSIPWECSRLTLGGVKWDTQLAESEAIELIRRAYGLGVNTFDTAHAYGGGQSEARLGLGLDGIRDRVFVSTKTMDRTYDGAMRQVELSLERLRTDWIDLLFVHSVDTDEQYREIMGPNSVLKALEELRVDGRVHHIGVSGHWVKDVLASMLTEYPFDAVLCPVGLFNAAYGYSFAEQVIPIARSRGMAVMGMKVYGAGRVKHAASVEPYLRFALGAPVDSLVIGCDTMAQLEQTVSIIASGPDPLPDNEAVSLYPEALAITQAWGNGEFNWVSHYVGA